VSEKRRTKRFQKKIEADYTSGGNSGKGFTKDISPGGTYIRSEEALIAGTLIDITLFLPNGKESRLKGVVRRSDRKNGHDEEGMGIEFLEMDEDFILFMEALSSFKKN